MWLYLGSSLFQKRVKQGTSKKKRHKDGKTWRPVSVILQVPLVVPYTKSITVISRSWVLWLMQVFPGGNCRVFHPLVRNRGQGLLAAFVSASHGVPRSRGSSIQPLSFSFGVHTPVYPSHSSSRHTPRHTPWHCWKDAHGSSPSVGWHHFGLLAGWSKDEVTFLISSKFLFFFSLFSSSYFCLCIPPQGPHLHSHQTQS